MDKQPNNIRETDAFKEWFAGLRDKRAKIRIDMRVRRLAMGNPGDHRLLGDKSTQSKDIEKARELSQNLEGIV